MYENEQGALFIDSRVLLNLLYSQGTPWLHVPRRGVCLFQGVSREDGSGRSFNLSFLGEGNRPFAVYARTV